MNDSFDLFRDWPEKKQNLFLKEYLTKTTKYLKSFEFTDTKNCYFFTPEFLDEAYHGNSITNLAALLLLLVKRNVLLPIRFVDDKTIIPATGTPVIYFIFSDWPIGNLSDPDFHSFKMVQDEELLKYANVLAN